MRSAVFVIDVPNAGTPSGQGTNSQTMNPAHAVTGNYANNGYPGFERTP